MTNPIPEYIDKQKLLEWLQVKTKNNQEPYNDYRIERAIAYEDLTKSIESGTFDDHSAQEEIAKLNSWLKNTEAKERHYDELRRWFNDMEARAIQAEQERDAANWKSLWYEAHVEDAERSARYWQGHYYEIVQERNSLLELLRYFVERTTIDHSYTHTPEYAKARSIIAKLTPASTATTLGESETRAIQAEKRWKEEHEAHTKRIAQFSDEKSARLQAEQEKDTLQKVVNEYEFWIKNIGTPAQQERDDAQARAIQAEKERNALLEGLKWYAAEGNWKARSRCGNCGHHIDADLPEDSAEFDAGETARSIIAKLEGSKPE